MTVLGRTVRQLRLEIRFGAFASSTSPGFSVARFFAAAATILNRHVDFTWRHDWRNAVVSRAWGGGVALTSGAGAEKLSMDRVSRL